MKYLKAVAFFVGGVTLTTGIFLLGLIAWGEEFEHAAPSITDGLFFAWIAISVLIGFAGAWWGNRGK